MLLVIVLWLLRGVAGTALHPVVATYLVLVPVFQELLVPRVVLERDKLFLGDVLDAPADPAPHGTRPWWLTRGPAGEHDAIRVAAPASESLLAYTLGRRELPDRGAILLTGLLRDRLPPLEDLVMAGNPGPIGTSSVIFVVVGGLFLMYRGVIDYRIPLLIVLAAFVTLLVLPIPIAITDGGPRWSWLAAREPSVGWAVGVTFVNYQLAASPLLFTAFFLATSPTVRPITRRGRTSFAMATGCLSADHAAIRLGVLGPLRRPADRLPPDAPRRPLPPAEAAGVRGITHTAASPYPAGGLNRIATRSATAACATSGRNAAS